MLKVGGKLKVQGGDQEHIFTFLHEECLSSENLFSHSDASWSELRIFKTVLSAQLGQQLRWFQTVSPGVITIAKRGAKDTHFRLVFI